MTDDDIIKTVILPHEGSVFTDDPDDAGGPTKFGITLNELSAWRGHPCSAEDVRDLTVFEATQIYRVKYLQPFQVLTGDIKVNVVDFGVNAGVSRAARMLQEIVGADVDGIIGPKTRDLSQARDWNPLFVGARLLFYENLIITKPTQIKYRRGWRLRSLSFIDVDLRRIHRAFKIPTEPVFGFMGKAA